MRTLAAVLVFTLGLGGVSHSAPITIGGGIIAEGGQALRLQREGKLPKDLAAFQKHSVTVSLFTGFVAGVIQTHPLLETSGKDGKKYDLDACCNWVSDYVIDHPEEWDLRGEEVVYRALKDRLGRRAN